MNTVLFLVLLLVASLVSTDALSCSCWRNGFGESTHCQTVEALKKSCQGGITDDVCFCCKICAKVEGEWCGGLWDFDGHCDVGLICDRGAGREKHHVRGKCVRKGTTISEMEHTTADIPTTDSTEISSGDKQAIADHTYLDSEISSGDEATDATNPTELSIGDEETDATNPTERVVFYPSPTNSIELSSGDEATNLIDQNIIV